MAVAESQGIQSDLIPKIATGFCSGLARTGGLCGAISGVIMSLGLINGRMVPGASVDETYESVQNLLEQFETRFGSTQCLSLTGVHLGTEEGQAEFLQNNQIERCLTYVQFTTRFVMEVIKSK